MFIAGAGPAGMACALKLAGTNLRIAIADKSGHPRDKICGDALSLDVISQLPGLSENLQVSFDSFAGKKASYGVKIYAPGGNPISIPFLKDGVEKCGYICRRKDFDLLLFNELKNWENIEIIENCRIKNIKTTDQHVVVETTSGVAFSRMVVGADGANSVVAGSLSGALADRDHLCSGLRVYYDNVFPEDEKNFIELYFLKEILPGYIWVFPLPGNQANVGIGVLSSEIVRRKIRLKDIFRELVGRNEVLKKRLHGAIALETPRGFSLPLGSKKRKISGNRFLLAGDAAGLVDPFTGEGVANAIRSGRVAAGHIENCFMQNNFSDVFNKAYDKEIYARMWKEFQVSKTLQKLSGHEALFNFVVSAANRSKKIRQFLTESMAGTDKKKLLARWISMQQITR